jgi:hypothetical protein
MLAMFAADYARADGAVTGGTTATVLNTYSAVAFKADTIGPNRIGKNTGAGAMDAQITYRVVSPQEVLLAMVYTRSSNTPNNNNSYMQGGMVLARLTEKGVEYGAPFDFPQLNGERAFMRPEVVFSDDASKALVMFASEDNGVNNNPQPVAFVVSRTGLNVALSPIPNTTRGNINKPTNLIQTALKQGITVQNPNDQRGPHSNAQIAANTWAVGMQYNNQAHEAYSVTLQNDGSIKMNWLRRYSNNAQHCRPQVAFDASTNTLYSTSVEADEQPAEIGFRLAAIDPATGLTKKDANGQNLNKVVVRSNPNQNKYVSEPTIGVVAPGKLAIGWAMTSKARNRNGDNGHAGGGQVPQLALFDGATLGMIGQPIAASAPYGRHAHIFTTKFGPNGEPAVAAIAGSSTGGGAGKQLLYPLTAEGMLGVKDIGKMYTVSNFSDVANLQARGKRNPNNQAKGFINGVGDVPNPGFDKPNGFMPEVKSFSASAVTGFSDQAAKDRGLKESVWLSLVPASWKQGIQTVPGSPTDKPGTNPDGTGPMPTTTTSTPTNPSGDQTSGGDTGSVTEGPDLAPGGQNPEFAETSGCNVSRSSSTDLAGFAFLALGAAALVRRNRKQEEK